MSNKKVEFTASFQRNYIFTEEQVLRNAKEWGIDITNGTDEQNEKAISSVVESLGKLAYKHDKEENLIMGHTEIDYPLHIIMNQYVEDKEEV